MTDPTRARRARIRRRLTAPLLAALLAAGTLTPAFADSGPVDPSNPADPGAAAPPTSTGSVQAAQLQAVATGQPVTVDSLTTATTTVLANPDGSLTQTTDALPVRVQQSGAWVPLDDTLTANPDGTVSTKATTTAVTLSGGGTNPLVTFTDQADQQLSLSMPFALPVPTLSGNTALYASALPGVDLSVSIDPQGNFRDVLIVHNAAAAANPDLKTLQLAATTEGLTLATATGGGMDANAPDGTTVFTSPTPTMWDSSDNTNSTGGQSTPSPSATATSAASAQSAARAAIGTADAAADPTTPTPTDTSTAGAGGAGTASGTASGTDGPGTGAQVAQVPMTTSSSGLTLTPDQSLLTGANTTYPVYIDPPVDNLTSNYFEAQQGCDSASSSNHEYDYAQTNGEGVGYQAYNAANGDCIGAERSFFEIDTSKLTSSMHVLSSTLDVTETYAARWSCSTTAPVTVKWTGGISRSMYWDTQPAALSTLGTITLGSAYNGADPADTTSCGGQNGSLAVTSAISSIAGKNSTWTFGLYNPDESSSSDFERFATDPKLITTYDIAPTIAASSVNTTPAAITTNAQGKLVDADPACGTGTPGWIGQTTINNGASNITMNATAVSPVGSTVATWFSLNDTGDGSGTPTQVTYNHTSYQASGAPASLAMSTTVTDGHQYNWSTQASDGTLTSNTVSDCRFNVDLTPPNQATVTSTDFPVAGSNTTKLFAGSTGSFTLTSTDPQPAGCSIPKCLTSGLAGFRYSLDQPIPTDGYSYTAADSTGTAQVKITPEGWGTHILYVEAVDNAGNSAVNPATYTFYAPWNPASHVTAGDLTHDNTPDLLATNSNGDLIMLPGDADPNGTNAHDTVCAPSNYLPGCQASPAADSPDNTSWSDFQIAHRGSLHNMTVDDLFAHQKNNATLYSVDNDGIHQGGVDGRFTLVHTVIPKPQCLPVTGRSNNCALYDATDWSTVDQMTAPGSVYGDKYADLITSEKGSSGDQLWLYRGSSSASDPLGPPATGTTATTPILLGTGDWSHFTLISPGTVGGDVNTNTAGTETLWARDTNSGILYSFSLAIDPTTGYPDEIAAPTTAPFTSAVTTTTGASLCAADASGSTTSGSAAIIWTCDQAPEQAFSLLADHTVRTEGLCLQASATAKDSLVTFDTCNSGNTLQQWTAGTTGSLVNTASGMCLADPSANQTRDTALLIWTCDNGPEQDWASQSGNQLPIPMPTMPTALTPVLTAAEYPTLASPGDGTGLGEPSLYAVTPTDEVVDYPGALPSSTGTANFATPADEGIFSNSANWWDLDGGTDSNGAAIDTENTTGTTDAALEGSANWATDSSRITSSDPTGTVLNLDGTTGYAATSGSVINTSGSYTVSVWAKLNVGFNPASHYTVVAQRDGTGLRCGFYLQYSDSFKGWTLVSPDTDTASPSAYYHAGDNITATGGQWTHLVGVFDATTDTMSLYVNGQLAGTGTNPTPWNSTSSGPLLIGGSDNDSNASQADFPGEISDVHIYDIALSPSAATTLNDTPAPINNLN
ncbi:LamG-like jellyroll fold domain-containing protein [Streptacidiphilus sp. P02-A3a]|uniref:LamG-like jellyroll fold domain-containing protein n=1 Tax=Streptacidiphilus sp. P02-A3a TaxID=2704468 RepID=UPI0015F8C236|nr:LamG-like jellyroll fold domain-containing protein [Streptacidiphilus sp. P02-A3a]QMU70137.1 hypothetical protein GXP74_19785 [Streptacidiphilus sp. P02-A3a]QMU70413.1 hypothetical protein GXP74_21570 [Streptacidiphilus sp. P02-A3a]